MKKILGIILVIIGLAGGGWLVWYKGLNQTSGLRIEAETKMRVKIDGQNVGETDFVKDKIKSGKHQINLETMEGKKVWEKQIELRTGVQTIIRRNEESGWILGLKPISTRLVELMIISWPDHVVVKVDDYPKGFSPLRLDGLEEGEHKLSFIAAGYQPMEMMVNLKIGHRAEVEVELEKVKLDFEVGDAQETSEATKSAEVIMGPWVIIGETPTGWLRIRAEAKIASEELGKIDEGEKLRYLEETSEDGWLKVETEWGEGWVSGRYAEIESLIGEDVDDASDQENPEDNGEE